MRSAAVVPVGLTRFRPADDGLVPVDPISARDVIARVEARQAQYRKQLGTRFTWLSDEWYLIAGLPLPPRDDYEDLPQQENGVGSIRAFSKLWTRPQPICLRGCPPVAAAGWWAASSSRRSSLSPTD